jgi:hypothetical protein
MSGAFIARSHWGETVELVIFIFVYTINHTDALGV